MDVHNREQRSRNMAAIRAKDTRPEMIVRKIAHRLGFRFRLHRRDLPGKPDLVFPRLKKAILVHGCYWHMHDCRWGCVTPKTNAEFWRAKREGNVRRDARNLTLLRERGWRVLTLWECQTKDLQALKAEIAGFLNSDGFAEKQPRPRTASGRPSPANKTNSFRRPLAGGKVVNADPKR